VVAPLKVPHAGWQLVLVPGVTSVQVTPGLTVPSFATIAVTVTAAAPGAIVPIGLVIVTETTLFELEPPPHPATTNAIAKYKKEFK
jgi:hypothetical protein